MLIIFDLDDTLIDTTGSIIPVKLKLALSKMIAEGLEVSDPAAALIALQQCNDESETTAQTISKFVFNLKADKKYSSIGIDVACGELPPEIKIFPLEQAQEVLKELATWNQLSLVSMGKTSQQLLKLEKAGIDSTLFSKIIISEGPDKKPHYQKILNELEVRPERTIVCGDRIQTDLTPAKELGCSTVHMKWGRGGRLSEKNPSHDVDFTIRNLRQIREVVIEIDDK